MSDIPDLEQRLREFAAPPDEAGDWADVLRRAGKRLPVPRFARRRLTLALAAAVVVAASLVGVLVAHGTRGASPKGPNGPAGPWDGPTIAYPLPSGMKVSLSDASSALGGPIVLPDTPQVTRADVGAVWMNQLSDGQGHTDTAVAVTFPSPRLIIRYERPPIPDSLAFIQALVKDSPGSRAISLHGVPAFESPQRPDGTNWGGVEFVAGGTTIAVMGHSDDASLEAIAQSIVDRGQAR